MPETYVLWVDGSKLSQGNAGAAVCRKDKDYDSWENSSVFLGENKETVDAELWAIAGKITLNSHQTPIVNNLQQLQRRAHYSLPVELMYKDSLSEESDLSENLRSGKQRPLRHHSVDS